MTEELLAELKRRANQHGMVVARAATLEEMLKLHRTVLDRGLAQLEERGALRILSPLPYLVVVLEPRTWRSNSEESAKTGPVPRPVTSRGYSYSFHKHSRMQSKAIALEDGGLGEGDALLAEILATLGESDPAPFRGVLEHFAPAKVRAALARVRATPPGKVRKSRTALFRYLLAKS